MLNCGCVGLSGLSSFNNDKGVSYSVHEADLIFCFSESAALEVAASSTPHKSSMLITPKVLKRVRYLCWTFLLVCSLPTICRAQSLDISSPAPISTNEVTGTIAARDLGDSRLTDHYYAFTGTPGDVLLTIKSTNLNGDVDVFTAGSLRPLLKITIYAESSVPVTKGIYLRKRENLILRVEARSPNDDEGTYSIRLGGSFELIARDSVEATRKPSDVSLPAVSNAPLAASTAKKGRRVSSVGARIAEPPPVEVAAAPTPEPTPANTPADTPAESPADATPAKVASEKTGEPEATRPTARRGRGRTPSRRARPASEPLKSKQTAEANPPTDTEKPSETTEPEAKPARPVARSGRRGTSRANPPPEPEPPTGPRLLIELQDGTRVERFMSTIRRVTVENNQIVVVGKDGQVERVRMVNVIRMSIEP